MADGISLALGQRVRWFREKQGKSQEELAASCGLHRTYVGGIERGERNPTVKNIAAIARALGISLAELVEGVDS